MANVLNNFGLNVGRRRKGKKSKPRIEAISWLKRNPDMILGRNMRQSVITIQANTQDIGPDTCHSAIEQLVSEGFYSIERKRGQNIIRKGKWYGQ